VHHQSTTRTPSATASVVDFEVPVIPKVAYPTPCATCRFIPTISVECVTALAEVSAGLDHVRHIFKITGLLHDRYLYLLQSWPREDQIAFLNDLSDHGLTSLDKVILAKRLSIHLKSIPQPHPDAEKEATRPFSSLSALQELMGLKDNEAFEEMMDIFEDLWAKSDRVNHLNREQWHKFTQQAIFSCPKLSNYDDSWPLKVYVKRRTAMGGKAEQARNSRSGVSVRRSVEKHQLTSMEWSGCPMHGLPHGPEQVDEEVWALLKAFGCQELCPLFMRAGIFSRESLYRFRDLSTEERTAVMNDVRGINLSVFQRRLLGRLICLA